MARFLTPYGYNVLFLDEGWAKRDGEILFDESGRPRPNTAMYPSAVNGVGMARLAQALRGRGIELGLWVIRGVPRRAVASFLPVWGSATNATLADAVRFDKPCFWSVSCYGSNYPSAAASDYYASVAALLKSWGVRHVKADCFFPNMPVGSSTQPNGYFDNDVDGFGRAMAAENISVMFSPGISVTVANASYLTQTRYCATFRITEDLWDLWSSSGDGTFPSGVRQKLDKAEEFAPFIGVGGSFPDLDMLPFGSVFHASKERGVYGPASPTRLTHDEQITAMTLWCMARSPLILGARLPLDPQDQFTLQLVTNPEILYLQNSTSGNAPISPIGAPANSQHAWTARPAVCPGEALPGRCILLALFNAGEVESNVSVDLPAEVLASELPLCARDLWSRQPLAFVGNAQPGLFTQMLPAHGAGAYLLWRTAARSTSSGALNSTSHACGTGADIFGEQVVMFRR